MRIAQAFFWCSLIAMVLGVISGFSNGNGAYAAEKMIGFGPIVLISGAIYWFLSRRKKD